MDRGSSLDSGEFFGEACLASQPLESASVQKLAQRAAAAEQIEHNYNGRDDEQCMNQTAAHMHGIAQKP